jgi:hypothetical protein
MREHAEAGAGAQGVENGAVVSEVHGDRREPQEVDREAVHLDTGDEEEGLVGVGAAVRDDGVDVRLGELLDVLGHAGEVEPRPPERGAQFGIAELAVERARGVRVRESAKSPPAVHEVSIA